jgi:phage terminase large subunit
MTSVEIKQRFNGKYKEVFTTKARYIHVWGGRGRGGSYFGTDYFLRKITEPKYFRGYFMREIFGDIRESLWRDFKDRIEENETVSDKFFHMRDDSMTVECLLTGNN